MEKNCIWQESEFSARVMPEARAGVLEGGLTLAQLRGDLCEMIHGWANILLICQALPTTEDLDGRFGHTSSSSRGGRSDSEAVAIKVQACEA